MLNSDQGHNKRKLESDNTELSNTSSFVVGTKLNADTRKRIPPSAHLASDPLINNLPPEISPNLPYTNFTVPNWPFYLPKVFIPYHPIPVPCPNQSPIISSNVGLPKINISEQAPTTCGLNGSIFEIPDPNNFMASSDSQTKNFKDDDFLKYCHLCKKSLEGNDIYTYSNESREEKYISDHGNLMEARTRNSLFN